MFMNASYHPSGRRSFLTRGLLWVLFFGFLSSAHAQYTATVDLNTKHQTFEGWGTSLAWWANVVGGYPDASRNDYVARVFDPTYGLGLNVVRYNIGGGENPQYLPPNTSYLQFRARVPGFLSSSTASYDWTQDANQRWVLQQAVQKGVTVSEAFSNSPPWWMTNSGSVTGATSGGNNLNPTYASNFADYLTSVVKHYHDTWGITFRTIEPFNEPIASWWKFGGGQEGAGFDRTTQNTFVKTLGASLASKSLSYTTVSASDENSIDDALLSLEALDSTAEGYLGQVNTHTYYGTERTQLASTAATGSKRLWVSEYGDGDATGLTMAYQILNDLQNLQPKSWIYWQAVDNSGGWGFLNNVLDGTTNYSYAFNEKYYVMANFSKFIRPGYQFVSISDSNSVAAYDGSGTVAVVTASNSSSAQEVTYNLTNLPSGMGSGPWTITPYRTSATENLVAQPPFTISSPAFVSLIPANSVTTFVVTSSALVPIVDGRTYYIFNKSAENDPNNPQVLEEGGWDTTPGKQLDVWAYGYNASSNTWPGNQLWVAHSAGGNNWEFSQVNTVSKGNELALDVAGTTSGSAVVQNERTDNPPQLWTLAPLGDGVHFKLVNVQTGLALHMTGWWGSGIDQETDPGGNDSFYWKFESYQSSQAETQLAMTTYTSPIFNSQDEQLSATLTTAGSVSPTGTVTFYDGSTVLGQANLTSNVASLNAGKLAVGTHYISAVYSGDSSNASSSTPVISVLSKLAYATTTTLTSTANPSASGQSVTFNASVSTTGTTPPTGSITFTSNGTTLATVGLTGVTASYSTSLTTGAYSIVATYSGDALNRVSSSPTLLQEVKGAGTTSSSVSLTSTPSAPIVGNALSLTAAVTGTGGTPTGKVFFLDGSTVIGNGALSTSGTVTITNSTLAVGTHSLTAYYDGDAAFAPATSSVDSVQVYAVPVGDYAIASSINQMKLSGTAAISVVTSGGFNQPITFSCSGLPAGYTCAFSPASITPSSTGIQTTQMAIVGQSTAALDSTSHGFITALAGLGIFGLPLCWRFRRKLGNSLLLLVLAGSLGYVIQGCTSSTPTAYNVVVTGTSLPLTHTVTVQVLK